MTRWSLDHPPTGSSRLLEDLNPDQQRVVTHPGGPMLVLAGAGTGKTRTVVHRVCRLIQQGVPPSRILLLTFTNKAAREMMDRVEQLLEGAAGRVVGGTFHSVGHRILRRYAELVGYTPRFGILDREDAADLMGSALADLSPEVPERRTPRPRLLVDLYSFVVNTGRDLEEVLRQRAPQFLDQGPAIAGVFRQYLGRKRRADVMDFDDLLLNWLLLLKRFPQARAELCTRFLHILVDEYQDTNRLQADVVDAMLGPDRNLTVVGDDAQSIYAFRGAEFANILGFPERYPDCTVFDLALNYRSTPPILRLASASIAHNERQFRRRLEAARGGDEPPLVVSTPSPEDQARWVVDQILALREEGFDLEQMAVLYRNHSHSLDLQVELTRRNVPYRVRSGLRFFEQRHVKDVLAHLRFADNPRDEVAFSRLVKLRKGFGPRLAARAWNAVQPASDPLAELVRLDPGSLDLPRQAAASLRALQALLAPLADEHLSSKPGEAVRHVVEGFYREWARDNLDAASSRLEDLEQLALFADSYPDLAAFLAEVSLLNDLSGEDQIGGPSDEVLTLSTVHQAKGLEWRVVFVLWLAEGRFPTVRAEDEEEERRLFYVAVTRAGDRLFLVYPVMARDRYRVDVLLAPSPFLSELPDEVAETLNVAPKPAPAQLEALPAGLYRLPGFVDSEDP